jgi:hypothetical protein
MINGNKAAIKTRLEDEVFLFFGHWGLLYGIISPSSQNYPWVSGDEAGPCMTQIKNDVVGLVDSK